MIRFFVIIAVSFSMSSCSSLYTAFYKPDTCNHEEQYKGKLKPKDFDAHKSKRPDMN